MNNTPAEKLSAMENVLDKLADAHGRVKCGYIWAMTNLIEELRNDISALEAKLQNTTPAQEE